jgi:transposase
MGLAPWVNSSAGKRKPGGITKRGNRATRALLIQGAWAHVHSKHDTALKRWYYKLNARVGVKRAIVGLARKLAELMWTLWRTQTDYQPFPSSSRRAPTPP